MDDEHLELSRLHREKKKLISKNDFLELSRVYNSCGEILFRQGKFREALTEHRAELDACSKAKDIIGIANANRRIGECLTELEDFNGAINHEKQHLELAIEANSLVEQQRAWATLGRTYLHQAEMLNNENNLTGIEKEKFFATLDEAENAFHKCFQLCTKLSLADITHFEMEQMKGRYYLNFGLVKDQRDDITGCISSIEKAIEVHKNSCQWDDLFRSQHSLSLICSKHGDFSKSLHHAEEAHEVAKRLKDVELEYEILAHKGRIELQQQRYRDAKSTFKRCYKLAQATGNDVVPIKRLLKYASNLNEEKKKLDSIDSDNLKERKEIYERLGDLSSSAELYKSAIEYYYLALRCSQQLGSTEEELAPLYVSLALTYADELKFEDAARYYELELKCWKNNPEERCNSLLNLANCFSRLNRNYEEIVAAYNRAFKDANLAKNRRLQKQCLESLAEFQNMGGKRDDEKITKRQLKDYQDIVYEEEHSESGDSEESLYMSDSNDEDSEKDSPRPCKKSTRRSVLRLRKNEKGETQLHRACISGKLDMVKRLIEDGHPVNIRDNSGWLPLHEASNHGFAEICVLLLEKGARINDRGGDHCNGFTPLHDAAANGRLNVIDVLIARGASCIAKDNEGMTPLDRLIEFRENPDHDLRAAEISKCKEVENMLKDRMKKLGTATDELVTQAEGESPPVATKEFRNSTCDQSDDEIESPALVRADEILPDCDDWIIDDVGDNKRERQRKRLKCGLLSFVERVTTKSKKKLNRQFKTPEKVRVTVNDRKRKRSAESSPSPSSSPEKIEVPSATDVPTASVTYENISASTTIEIGVRVNVKVMETTFLISVPTGETISWLSIEAAQRYFTFSGQKPILTLSIGNGALLSLNDQAASILKNDDEVVAHFQSWETLVIQERYLEACADDKVVSTLAKAESYAIANFAKFKMESMTCSSVLRAMYNLNGVREVNLSDNFFEPGQLQLIANLLASLPLLQSLDISNCDLTDSSLLTIVEHCGCKPFLKINHLKMGYNPLLNDGCNHLLEFLQHFPNLSSISIPSICTSGSSLNQTCGKKLSESLCVLRKLQKLDISFTRYPRETYKDLMNSLSKVPLAELDLSSTVSKSDATTLCDLLSEWLQQPSNAIKILCLSLCFLNDECIRKLTLGLQIRNLERLDVSGNGDITSASIDLLLSIMAKDKLNVSSCAKMQTKEAECSASFPMDDFDSFDEYLNIGSPVF